MDNELPKQTSRTQTSVHDLLCLAIDNKRLIEFEYQGRLRIAEPHDYGIINNTKKLLIYQVRGEKTRYPYDVDLTLTYDGGREHAEDNGQCDGNDPFRVNIRFSFR